MDSTAHWNEIYRTRAPDQVSWFEPAPALSLELIEQTVPSRDSAIIDIGAGASALVDALLHAGYERITVLDLSGAALAQTRQRIGDANHSVEWLEGDMLSIALPGDSFDLWHDRAVFHFLTSTDDRNRYVAQVRRAVHPGGHVLIATFAEEGPMRCSGLEVARYSPEELQRELGDDFHLVTSRRHTHRTPWGAQQAFTYCLFRLGTRDERTRWFP